MWGAIRRSTTPGMTRPSLAVAQWTRQRCLWTAVRSFSCLPLANCSPFRHASHLHSECLKQACVKYATSSESQTGATGISSFPSGDVCEIPVPDRLRLISWLAQHNAIDLSFFSARAKRSDPLGPEDARPVDYSWIELTLRLSDRNATRLRDVFRQASRPDALRSGRLLEVLDCFAGDVAFAYCWPSITLNEEKSDLFVTVAIDSIRLFDHESTAFSDTPSCPLPYISVTKDLILRGFVSCAGTSSVEITAELHQEGRLIGSAYLVFVHVGQDGKAKRGLPPLSKECDNPEIALQLREADDRQLARKERASKGLSFRGPDQEEAEFLHNTWMTTTNTTGNVRWIRDTRLESNILMQPETITVYGRAFGGYIMRSALELSVLTAQRFLGQAAPVITGMEDIRFFEAVRLGDILRLSSHVVWSDKDELQIRVVASSSPVGCPLKRTNCLVFYFKQNPDRRKMDPVDLQVYPQSYGEFMWFLEARRRAIKRNRRRRTRGSTVSN